MLAAALALGSMCCGGGGVGEPLVPAAAPRDPTWPSPGVAPPDALDVRAALSSLESVDGAAVRVRAYLVAVTLPCPACAVGERTAKAPEPAVGRSRRPRLPDMPGCLPCPTPAATFGDRASLGADDAEPRLRATGAAEGLQSRHVGKAFLLTGTFHARGVQGPELEVTDVRALPAADVP